VAPYDLLSGKSHTSRKLAAIAPRHCAINVGQNVPAFKSLGDAQRDGHGGIDVRTGDVADGVDHGEYDQPERERDADVSDVAAGNNRSRPSRPCLRKTNENVPSASAMYL